MLIRIIRVFLVMLQSLRNVKTTSNGTRIKTKIYKYLRVKENNEFSIFEPTRSQP